MKNYKNLNNGLRVKNDNDKYILDYHINIYILINIYNFIILYIKNEEEKLKIMYMKVKYKKLI